MRLGGSRAELEAQVRRLLADPALLDFTCDSTFRSLDGDSCGALTLPDVAPLIRSVLGSFGRVVTARTEHSLWTTHCDPAMRHMTIEHFRRFLPSLFRDCLDGAHDREAAAVLPQAPRAAVPSQAPRSPVVSPKTAVVSQALRSTLPGLDMSPGARETFAAASAWPERPRPQQSQPPQPQQPQPQAQAPQAAQPPAPSPQLAPPEAAAPGSWADRAAPRAEAAPPAEAHSASAWAARGSSPANRATGAGAPPKAGRSASAERRAHAVTQDSTRPPHARHRRSIASLRCRSTASTEPRSGRCFFRAVGRPRQTRAG